MLCHVTATFQAGGHVHARRLEADTLLQLPPAVCLVEAETSVDPEVTPVELPAFEHRRCRGESSMAPSQIRFDHVNTAFSVLVKEKTVFN